VPKKNKDITTEISVIGMVGMKDTIFNIKGFYKGELIIEENFWSFDAKTNRINSGSIFVTKVRNQVRKAVGV